jgi:hypothetical protein
MPSLKRRHFLYSFIPVLTEPVFHLAAGKAFFGKVFIDKVFQSVKRVECHKPGHLEKAVHEIQYLIAVITVNNILIQYILMESGLIRIRPGVIIAKGKFIKSGHRRSKL